MHDQNYSLLTTSLLTISLLPTNAAAISRLRIFLAGFLEDRFGRSLLDDPAVLHHHDVVGHRADDREIVADEQIGEIVAPSAARAGARRSASAPSGRAPRSARRAPRPWASGSSRGQWRCAGAGRRRIHADSGCAVSDRGCTSSSASAARRSRSRAADRRLVHQQPLGDDLADRHARRQRAEGILEARSALLRRSGRIACRSSWRCRGRRNGSRLR